MFVNIFKIMNAYFALILIFMPLSILLDSLRMYVLTIVVQKIDVLPTVI